MIKIEVGGKKDGITISDTDVFDAVADLIIAAQSEVENVHRLLYENRLDGVKKEDVDGQVEEFIVIMLRHLGSGGYIRSDCLLLRLFANLAERANRKGGADEEG